MRPVELLLDRLPVDERWCLVHATHITDAESAGIAARSAVVGLCPITEANLGDGVFPAQSFMDRGGRFGVGSDSNVLIDAAEELRLLEYGQRLSLRTRNAMARTSTPSVGRSLFDAALAGGAQALGAPSTLAVGQTADLVSLKAEDPALAYRQHDRWLDGWIFSGSRQTVDCVWRAGTRLVNDGRHIHRDAIGKRFRHALHKVLQAS